VTLFRARERPQGRYDDPTAGWDKIAAGGLQIYEVPGDHKHLLVPPNVSAVARQLKVCLERNQDPN
jgi:thioesterase domain-containing protein